MRLDKVCIDQAKVKDSCATRIVPALVGQGLHRPATTSPTACPVLLRVLDALSLIEIGEVNLWFDKVCINQIPVMSLRRRMMM